MKKQNKLTKNGLTGNSGFNVAGMPAFHHISANYASNNGMVFVEHEDRYRWQRMPAKMAVEKKKHIISCSYCSKPAISIDHCWPYLIENTYCEDHKETATAVCLGKPVPNQSSPNAKEQ